MEPTGLTVGAPIVGFRPCADPSTHRTHPKDSFPPLPFRFERRHSSLGFREASMQGLDFGV
ncbi:hypothetical protein [Haladaptatus sp. R4]|uniref:hypothetical protein n=1 Tax=Haladaptatus sp. R4 TaxID=1679489 RepID=UPI0012371498|nr:hypothetical protein [Haladaptatus sp. R4]